MSACESKEKDVSRILNFVDDQILQHRKYFASWRSERWSEFDETVKAREENRGTETVDIRSQAENE